MAAAATNSSVELAVFEPPTTTTTLSFLFRCFGWGALSLAGAASLLCVCLAVYVVARDELSRRRRRAEVARRQLLRRGLWAQKMGGLRNAAYERVVACRIAVKPCVVCRTGYEAGETCSFLPRCAHMFHKRCIAAWLRHHDTCPICDATLE